MSSKRTDETALFVRMAADHNGWAVNPDRRFVDRLIEGLTTNYNRYGYYQCPCRDSWDGDRGKDADIVCPCSYCEADVREYGQCLCGLFLSQEFLESGAPVGRIPERRPEELYP